MADMLEEDTEELVEVDDKTLEMFLTGSAS